MIESSLFRHLVYFGVEVDEEDEGDDSEDDEAAPVVVGRVGGVRAQRRRHQLHRVVDRLVGRGVHHVRVLDRRLEEPEIKQSDQGY